MKLRLLARKGKFAGKRKIKFAVINVERAGKFPCNFVCMLPSKISTSAYRSSPFFRIFGKGSRELAKALLTEALKEPARLRD